MSDGWRRLRLDDLAIIVTGATPKSSDMEAWGNEVDFVTPSDQIAGSREARPERRLSAAGISLLRKRLVPAGSTALTCIGSTIGKVSRLREDSVTNQQINTIIARGGVADPSYLYYLIRGWSPTLKVAASGSATPIVNKSVLSQYVFEVPDLHVQRAIGEVLNALDNKIAADERTLLRVEELMIEQAGWSDGRVRVSELSNHSVRSVSPKSFAPSVSLFSLPAFDAGAEPEIASSEDIKSVKFLIDEPVVLVSKLNPRIPRVWDVAGVPGEMAVASTEFVVLAPKAISSSQLWASLKQSTVIAELGTKVAGTSGSHQRVKPADVLQLLVPDPRRLPAGTRAAIDDLGALAAFSRRTKAFLDATRDGLLPLLMSGKLRVKDAEKIAEEVL